MIQSDMLDTVMAGQGCIEVFQVMAAGITMDLTDTIADITEEPFEDTIAKTLEDIAEGSWENIAAGPIAKAVAIDDRET